MPWTSAIVAFVVVVLIVVVVLFVLAVLAALVVLDDLVVLLCLLFLSCCSCCFFVLFVLWSLYYNCKHALKFSTLQTPTTSQEKPNDSKLLSKPRRVPYSTQEKRKICLEVKNLISNGVEKTEAFRQVSDCFNVPFRRTRTIYYEYEDTGTCLQFLFSRLPRCFFKPKPVLYVLLHAWHSNTFPRTSFWIADVVAFSSSSSSSSCSSIMPLEIELTKKYLFHVKNDYNFWDTSLKPSPREKAVVTRLDEQIFTYNKIHW